MRSLLERGLYGLHGAQHRIEPLLHRLQAADRGERPIGGTIRAQQPDRLRRGVLQFLERAALTAVGLHRAFDPLQGQACDARGAFAADLRQIALRLLLIGVIGAERVEASLLLVVERLIELFDHRGIVRTACSMASRRWRMASIRPVGALLSALGHAALTLSSPLPLASL